MSNNFEPCAEMQSSRNELEFPEYSLIPDDFWPEEAYQGRDVRGTRKSVEKRNGEYVIHDNHY